MLFRAIAGLEPGSTTPRDYSLPHRKTHSFDPERFRGEADVAIFLFGDVVSSVHSTRKRRYTKEHFSNCGSDLDPEKVDIFDRDHFNYERMFDAWMKPATFPHLCVRYERLHELAPIVSALVGKTFELPPRQPRLSTGDTVAAGDRMRIETAYASLIRKVSQAADIQWWGLKPARRHPRERDQSD